MTLAAVAVCAAFMGLTSLISVPAGLAITLVMAAAITLEGAS